MNDETIALNKKEVEQIEYALQLAAFTLKPISYDAYESLQGALYVIKNKITQKNLGATSSSDHTTELPYDMPPVCEDADLFNL